MRKIVIFTGKSIYKRETVSNKNIRLMIELGYTSTIGTALQTRRRRLIVLYSHDHD